MVDVDVSGMKTATVFVCSLHRFHRHLDLCGMFDRCLCRTIVVFMCLGVKAKLHHRIFRGNVECTSLTTSTDLFDLGLAFRRGFSAFFQ